MNQAPTEDKPHSYKQIKVGLMNQAPTVNQIPAIPLNNIYISKGGLDESSPYNKSSPYRR